MAETCAARHFVFSLGRLLGAFASEPISTSGEWTVRLIEETTQFRVPSEEELSALTLPNNTCDNSSQYRAIDRLEYLRKISRWDISLNNRYIGTYTITIDYVYGSGINEEESGITQVEIYEDSRVSPWTRTWGAPSDFQRRFSCQISANLYNPNTRIGAICFFKGYQTGDYVNVELEVVDYAHLSA